MRRGHPEEARRPSPCSLHCYPPTPSRLHHKSIAPSAAGREPDLNPTDACDGEPSRYTLGPWTSLKRGQMVAVLFPGSQKGRCSSWRPHRLGRDGGDRQFLFSLPEPCQPCGRRLLATSSRQVLLRPQRGIPAWVGKAANPLVFIPVIAVIFLANQTFYFCYCDYNQFAVSVVSFPGGTFEVSECSKQRVIFC